MQDMELQHRFNNTPVLDAVPDSKAQEQLEELFKHPGFTILWGLMLGARQAYLYTLANLPCGSSEEIRRLGVIQGTIKGIDLLRDTALEQTIPSAGEEGAAS